MMKRRKRRAPAGRHGKMFDAFSIDNYNHIVIDWLTGRAKLERADIIK